MTLATHQCASNSATSLGWGCSGLPTDFAELPMPVAGGHHSARQHAVLRRVLGLHPAAAVALFLSHGRGVPLALALECTRPLQCSVQ